MVRIGRALEICQMARDACPAAQAEIIISVTLIALQGGMRSGKRKAGSRMIKGSSGPRCRAVT